MVEVKSQIMVGQLFERIGAGLYMLVPLGMRSVVLRNTRTGEFYGRPIQSIGLPYLTNSDIQQLFSFDNWRQVHVSTTGPTICIN